MSESLLGMTCVVGPRGLKGHAKTLIVCINETIRSWDVLF